MYPDTQLKEIISWRIVTELWRRFPDRFLLLETHPGGGQYDCLRLVECQTPTEPLIDINREGSLHFHGSPDNESHGDWTQRFLSNPIEYLDHITSSIRLKKPERLPPSSPSTLCFRYITELLSRSLASGDYWECRMGSLDTSGWGGGPHTEWFQQFPTTESEPRVQPKHPKIHHTSCYWFVLRDQVSILCLDTDGRLHRRDGQVFHLAKLYAKQRKVWALITDTAMDYLP